MEIPAPPSDHTPLGGVVLLVLDSGLLRFNARMTPIRANIVGGPPARRRLGGFQSGGPLEVHEGRDCAPFSAQNDFLVSSSLISRACSSVSPIAGRPSSNLAGARACLSQTIQPVDPFLTR